GLLGGKTFQAGRYTFSTRSPYRANSQLLPSGLLGPVKISTMNEAKNVASGYYSEFSHEGFYLKDYFVYRSPIDQVYHLYYNIGNAGPKQHWRQAFNEKQFGHATSEDLRTWEIHDTILPVVSDSWESDVVSAPFVVRHDDKFFMAYTGFGPGANQRMGIAVSDDLFNWERVPENPVAVGPEWTSWQERGWADYRDPGLLKWKDQWIAFNTVKKGRKNAVAISVSDNLIDWEHLPEEKAVIANWGNPESALAFERNGKVYLIASQPWQGNQMWVTDDPLAGEWKTIPFNFPQGDWSGWEYITAPDGQELLSAFLWKKNGNIIRFWKLEWAGGKPFLVKGTSEK
ncbi:MAG: hypothetical protein ABR523_08140, partial [Desulfurivibrionaceae bacterium]